MLLLGPRTNRYRTNRDRLGGVRAWPRDKKSNEQVAVQQKHEGVIMRKMILTLAVLAAGCAGERWTKAGGTQAESERDFGQCRYEASVATASMRDPIEQALMHRDLMNQCLQLRGYGPQAQR